MKHIFTIILLVILYNSSFAQYEEVLLYYGNKSKPRWVLNCTDDTKQECNLTSYYPNGKLQGKAKIYLNRSSYRPNGDAIIYYPDGSVRQQLIYETGTLLNYYPTGELEEKMVTPINGDVEYKYKYYKTGQLWEEEEAKREPGRENLSYGHGNNKDVIYDNHGYSYNYKKTFHSNGNLQFFTFIDTDSPTFQYVYQFYSPDGQLDTTAKRATDGRYSPLYQYGKRYNYHSNGQLREISEFGRDKIIGEQLRWAENGQLIWKLQYKDETRFNKKETWWDNGQKKEVGYYIDRNKHGPILKWHRDGQIIEQGSYYGDKVVGLSTVWDTLGGLAGQSFGSIEDSRLNYYYRKRFIDDKTVWLTAEGEFKDGMREGKWQFYYARKGLKEEKIGGICAMVNYKNGVLDGIVTVYLPNGERSLQANFKDGFLDGEYISKRESGLINRMGDFKNHKKDGIWKMYHYNNSQVYRIEKYENGVYKEIYGEWDADGFQKQERIDNPEKKEVEYYTYYKSGMKMKHTIPYGRKHMNTYQYDTSGYLKKTTILIHDNPKNYTQIEYHPNGQKASQLYVLNGKQEGTYWAWYPNGKLKMEIPFENGKRQGKKKLWDENGVETTQSFNQGIQLIPNSAEEIALECSCNRPPDDMKTRFAQWFLDYVDYEKVKQRTAYYSIPEQSYKRLYARRINMYDNDVSGRLDIINDFHVDIYNGLRLDFTPCRRGVNRTHLEIDGSYNKQTKKPQLYIRDFDLSIEFPQNLLRLYDVENQKPLVTSIKKYKHSSVRFKVKQLFYEDDGEIPTIQMVTDNEAPCYQISEIGQTGVLFNGYNIQVDFSPRSTIDSDWSQIKKATKNNYQIIGERQHYFLPSQRYLIDFIGVYFGRGKLYIPYNDIQITANAQNIFVSGTEIYGNLEIASDVNLSLESLKNLPDYLKSKGFEILEYNIEENEILRIFWRFKP